jgi:hypothetical protein
VPIDFADAEHADDVRVQKPSDHARLGLEVLEDPGLGVARGDELHRHAPAQRGVVRQVDDAHAAAADQPLDAELAKLLGRCPEDLLLRLRGAHPLAHRRSRLHQAHAAV